MYKISEVLKKLMEIKGMRTAELARRVNLPQPTVHRIVTGVSPTPHISSLTPIAEFFSISVDQLRGIEPLPKHIATLAGLAGIPQLKQVPQLTWEQAMHWPMPESDLEGDNKPLDLVFTDGRVGEQGFALKIEDASMEPLFPQNTVLIIDPEQQAIDRGYVIAGMDGQTKAVFRQVLFDGDIPYLKALSPELSHFPMMRVENGNRIIGALVQARKDYTE